MFRNKAPSRVYPWNFPWLYILLSYFVETTFVSTDLRILLNSKKMLISPTLDAGALKSLKTARYQRLPYILCDTYTGRFSAAPFSEFQFLKSSSPVAKKKKNGLVVRVNLWHGCDISCDVFTTHLRKILLNFLREFRPDLLEARILCVISQLRNRTNVRFA